MPKMDGITACKYILKERPHTKVIAFTMFEDQGAVSEMIMQVPKGTCLKTLLWKTCLLPLRKYIWRTF